jgi:hypothetical protein
MHVSALIFFNPSRWLWHASLRVLLPLLLGLACYAFYRPDSKFYLGLENPWMSYAHIYGNAPDPLWAYAFCQALFMTGADCFKTSWLLVPAFGIGFELLQGVLIPGTPSFNDTLCYLAACVCAWLTPFQFQTNTSTK